MPGRASAASAQPAVGPRSRYPAPGAHRRREGDRTAGSDRDRRDANGAGKTRTLRDSLGAVEVPAHALWSFVEFRNQAAAGFARRTGQPPDRVLGVIESVPVALQAPGLAQAAYIDYEWQRAGGVWRGLSLVILGAIMSDGSWLFYETYVASPTQSVAQNLPVLVRIWNSGLTAQHVIQERLDNALNSLREAGEIWRQTTQNRQQAEQRMANNWTEAFCGSRVVVDTHTGIPH